MEREQSRHSRGDMLSGWVTIINDRRQISVPRGSRASDLLTAIRKELGDKANNLRIDPTTSIVLNGKVLQIDKNGKLSENPILVSNFAISIMPKITGG